MKDKIKWNPFDIFICRDFWKSIGKNLLELIPTFIELGLNIALICLYNSAVANGEEVSFAIYALIASTCVSLILASIPTFWHGRNAVKFTIAILLTLCAAFVYFFCTFKSIIGINSTNFFSIFIWVVSFMSVFQFFYSILSSVEISLIKEKKIELMKAKKRLTQKSEDSKYKA